MATFRTRARTLDMLGRQQIAGIPTAISELFKNAHDAYADRVEIDYYRADRLFVLRDDGMGMTEEEFVSRWLTIGTESKLNAVGLEPPPHDPTKKRRPMLGEKGERGKEEGFWVSVWSTSDNSICETRGV